MKIVMLNDYPWAVAPDDADENELRELGDEEVRRRGWTPYLDWKPGEYVRGGHLVHVHVKDAIDISDKLGKKKAGGKA